MAELKEEILGSFCVESGTVIIMDPLYLDDEAEKYADARIGLAEVAAIGGLGEGGLSNRVTDDNDVNTATVLTGFGGGAFDIVAVLDPEDRGSPLKAIYVDFSGEVDIKVTPRE
jgi:hypothetical protein